MLYILLNNKLIIILLYLDESANLIFKNNSEKY